MIKTKCKFNQWKFPGGEIGVKLTEDPECIQPINWLVEPQKMHEEFFVIANLVDALKRKRKDCYIQLKISYLPYARQDRVCHIGESHARSVFERMLLDLPVEEYRVYDPHSDSDFTRDDRTFVYPQEHLAREMLHKLNSPFVTYNDDILRSTYDVLIAPDKGAEEKTKKLSDLTGIRYICLEKERVDGKVIHKPLQPKKRFVSRALVVDDICDGGATFLSVAEAVRKYNPNHFCTIDLWVSHGIFSKGLGELKKHFDQISCYNLMNPDLVDQVPHKISPFKKEQ